MRNDTSSTLLCCSPDIHVNRAIPVERDFTPQSLPAWSLYSRQRDTREIERMIQKHILSKGTEASSNMKCLIVLWREVVPEEEGGVL